LVRTHVVWIVATVVVCVHVVVLVVYVIIVRKLILRVLNWMLAVGCLDISLGLVLYVIILIHLLIPQLIGQVISSAYAAFDLINIILHVIQQLNLSHDHLLHTV